MSSMRTTRVECVFVGFAIPYTSAPFPTWNYPFDFPREHHQTLDKTFREQCSQGCTLNINPHYRLSSFSIIPNIYTTSSMAATLSPKTPMQLQTQMSLLLSRNRTFLCFDCPDKHWHHHPIICTTFSASHWVGIPGMAINPILQVLPLRWPTAQHSSYQWSQRMQKRRTQLYTNSWITDRCDYVSTKYPAKKLPYLGFVACLASRSAMYVQYISLEDDQGELHALITGLAVEYSHRRRGFWRALVLFVVSRMSHCKEIWADLAAASFYFRCGFMRRARHWDFSVRTVIPQT